MQAKSSMKGRSKNATYLSLKLPFSFLTSLNRTTTSSDSKPKALKSGNPNLVANAKEKATTANSSGKTEAFFQPVFEDPCEVNQEQELGKQREEHHVGVYGADSCHCEVHEVKAEEECS